MPAQVLQGFLLDVENRPGTLHHVTKRLADASVNIEGIGGMSCESHAVVALVTENTLATRDVLREVGVNVRPVEFLALKAEHKPGVLDRYLTALGEAGLNVVCLISLIAKEPTLAFAVDDPVKAREVFKQV